MITTVKSANMLLMFLLELTVYAASVIWALALPVGRPLRLLVALAALAALITAWALFGSPKAPRPARGAARAVLEILWFGTAAVALAAAGHPAWAVVFSAFFAVNGTLRFAWKQKAPGPVRAP